MKTCSCCHAEKPLDAFSKNAGRCKPCIAAYTREHRRKHPEYSANYYAANREKRAANRDKWLAAHPGYRAEWRAKNIERDNANRARWYAEHPSHTAEWRAAHPLECQVYGINKTARARGASGPGITADDWRATLERFGHRCAYCGASGADQTLECDHVIAVSRGGEHNLDNIVPACAACNAKKGARGILCMANVAYAPAA